MRFNFICRALCVDHHRHEQHERRAGLLVVVDGFEYARAGRVGQFDHHGRGVHVREYLDQERRFETDRDRLAVVAARDGLVGRNREVDVLRREVDPVVADVHADQVGGRVRADGHALDAVHQLDAVDEHLVGVVGRDHGVVVRVVALDQAAYERVALEYVFYNNIIIALLK